MWPTGGKAGRKEKDRTTWNSAKHRQATSSRHHWKHSRDRRDINTTLACDSVVEPDVVTRRSVECFTRHQLQTDTDTSRQTDRHVTTDRQTERQTDTSRQTDRQTCHDRQTDRHLMTDRQTDTSRQTDRQFYESKINDFTRMLLRVWRTIEGLVARLQYAVQRTDSTMLTCSDRIVLNRFSTWTMSVGIQQSVQKLPTLGIVTYWQPFHVRRTCWSRLLDCLQLNGARDLEVTWSHVWLSW